jgi:ABC-type siderophore export system fused ATPase/permease subunit
MLRDEGRLIVAIIHDEIYFDVADRVIEVSGGRIVEKGVTE